MQSYCEVFVVFVALPIYIIADRLHDLIPDRRELYGEEHYFSHSGEDYSGPGGKLPEQSLCKLPGYPENGIYSVEDETNPRPGLTLATVKLSYSCHSGYKLIGSKNVSCIYGSWNKPFPECVLKPQCSLIQHESVSYFCFDKNLTSQNVGHPCGDTVEDDIEVQPKCREPVYHYKGVLENMHCRDGKWDHIIICSLKNTTCSLPPFPKDGYYSLINHPNFGKTNENLHLNYFCNSGFKLVGAHSQFCISGWWSDKPPKCISQCLLNKHASVQYLCLQTNSTTQYGAKECEEMVDEGTVVKSVCRENYYNSGFFPNMHCNKGEWDIVNFCSPQCGLVTSEGEQMILGGRSAKRGELPWHAGIYTKTTNPYKQICGGSLISKTVIISAAHCFWMEHKQLPPSNYAVAVGKLYRPWNNPRDEHAQKSEVREVKIPSRFLGAATNYQDDIAMVIVQTAFEFRTYVRPICIDFESTFNRRQLYVGAIGKVAGWGLTEEDGIEARTLQVVELPYVEIETCIAGSSPAFYAFITSDKICAGSVNGTARTVCKGDSGGGLSFKALERGAERYFLRGIASTAPRGDHLCNAHVYTAFTEVRKHEEFIKEHFQ